MPAIARELEGQFLILFVLFFLASLGLVIWYEVRHETGDDGWDTAIAIGMGMSYCVVISTALAYVIVEGAAMLAEQFNKKRYAAGLAEGQSREEQAEGQATSGKRNGRRGTSAEKKRRQTARHSTSRRLPWTSAGRSHLLADRFLQKRYAAGFVEGFAEGLAEVRAERQAEGQVDLKRDREVWEALRNEAPAKARSLMRYRLPLREESGSFWLSERLLQKRYAAGRPRCKRNGRRGTSAGRKHRPMARRSMSHVPNLKKQT